MNKNDLLEMLRSSSSSVDPVFLLKGVPEAALESDAFLYIGKVSERFFEGIEARLGASALRKKLILGIYPKGSFHPAKRPGLWIAAEHPLPGEGSFRAGREILEFFDALRRIDCRRLTVFLSGGASSLAWLPKSGMSHAELLRQLNSLYRAGLDIHELNARRSKLCQLKAGGAARWLKYLAPRVQTQVFVLSDVAPFGAQIVGSGPFWDGQVPHRVLADNSTWVKALTAQAQNRGISILHSSSGHLGSWQSWVQSAIQELQPTLREKRSGIFIFGGEPSVRLPARNSSGHLSPKGGRQSHIALALVHRLRPWILQGRIEILAMSSDGSDGNSRAAGVYIDSEKFRKRLAQIPPEKIKFALQEFQSARFFGRLGMLVQAEPGSPRSNVQDALLIRVL